VKPENASVVCFGGLIGSQLYSNIFNSSAAASIDGSQLVHMHATGGLMGCFEGGTAQRNYATLNMNSPPTMQVLDFGGLVGYLAMANVDQCYFSGKINIAGVSEFVGGLVGTSGGLTVITNSYTVGSITGDIGVGGFVGFLMPYFNYTFVFTNCYSAMDLSGKEEVGGLLGRVFSGVPPNLIIMNACFWDVEISHQPSSPFGGFPLTTSQMHKQTTFSCNLYTGYDFITVWKMNDGFSYPWLQNTNGSKVPSLKSD